MHCKATWYRNETHTHVSVLPHFAAGDYYMKITKDELTKLAEILDNPAHSLDLASALYSLLADRKFKLHIEDYDMHIELT